MNIKGRLKKLEHATLEGRSDLGPVYSYDEFGKVVSADFKEIGISGLERQAGEAVSDFEHRLHLKIVETSQAQTKQLYPQLSTETLESCHHALNTVIAEHDPSLVIAAEKAINEHIRAAHELERLIDSEA